MQGVVIWKLGRQGTTELQNLLTSISECNRELITQNKQLIYRTKIGEKWIKGENDTALEENTSYIRTIQILNNRFVVTFLNNKNQEQQYVLFLETIRGTKTEKASALKAVELLMQHNKTQLINFLYNKYNKSNKVKEKDEKHIIWSSEVDTSDKAVQEVIKERWDDFGERWTKQEALDYLYELSSMYLGDEKMNLGKVKTEGNLVGIADLGLWNGRRSAYKEYNTIKFTNILDNLATQGDSVEIYVQGVDVKARVGHHDGINFITIREVTDEKGWQRLAMKIYNQQPYTQKEVQACTRGIGKHIRKVYGW